MSCVVPYVDAENEPPQQQQARLKAVKKRRKSVAAPSRAEPIRAAVEERSVAVESDTAALEHGTPKASAPQESAQRTPNTQREQRLRAKYEKACDARDKLKFQVRPLMSPSPGGAHVHSPRVAQTCAQLEELEEDHEELIEQNAQLRLRAERAEGEVHELRRLLEAATGGSQAPPPPPPTDLPAASAPKSLHDTESTHIDAAATPLPSTPREAQPPGTPQCPATLPPQPPQSRGFEIRAPVMHTPAAAAQAGGEEVTAVEREAAAVEEAKAGEEAKEDPSPEPEAAPTEAAAPPPPPDTVAEGVAPVEAAAEPVEEEAEQQVEPEAEEALPLPG